MFFRSNWFKRFFLGLATLLFITASTHAQVRVVKKYGDFKNPAIIFKGVSGDANISSMVASDLKKCGWFEIKTGGPVDYNIAGKVQAGKLALAVFNADGSRLFSVTATVDSANPRMAAHKTVDGILQKLFGIKGICSTQIAFCSETSPGSKEIYICDFDGSNTKRITSNRTLSVEPEWTPGNHSIIYTMYGKSSTNIVQTELANLRSRRIAQFPGLNAGGAISPNGKILAMILSRGKSVDLFIKQIGRPSIKQLTRGRAAEASPCWSPDGRRICYVSDISGGPRLYVINAGGGQPNRLSTIGTEAVSPDWSGDNKIVYSTRMGRSYSIGVLDLSGKTEGRSIVNAAGDWEGPSWAPDNRHIVCSRKLNGSSSLYIIDTFSGKVHKLLSARGNLSLPSWSDIY